MGLKPTSTAPGRQKRRSLAAAEAAAATNNAENGVHHSIDSSNGGKSAVGSSSNGSGTGSETAHGNGISSPSAQSTPSGAAQNSESPPLAPSTQPPRPPSSQRAQNNASPAHPRPSSAQSSQNMSHSSQTSPSPTQAKQTIQQSSNNLQNSAPAGSTAPKRAPVHLTPNRSPLSRVVTHGPTAQSRQQAYQYAYPAYPIVDGSRPYGGQPYQSLYPTSAPSHAPLAPGSGKGKDVGQVTEIRHGDTNADAPSNGGKNNAYDQNHYMNTASGRPGGNA